MIICWSIYTRNVDLKNKKFVGKNIRVLPINRLYNAILEYSASDFIIVDELLKESVSKTNQ